MQKMPTVLITGVAGLLGANFSRYLLNKGYKIVGIDDFSGGYDFCVPKNIQCYEIQLGSNQKYVRKDIEFVFDKEKPDYVFHFAAHAAVCLSPFTRHQNYTNNILASADIINACINYDVKKVIFSSSMDVYGNNKAPFTEDMVPAPLDPYGIAKYAVEMDLKSASDFFGLNYSIVRPHNVVGIYQNIWDRYRNVIGIWTRKILAGEPITIYGDGTQIRAFSDISFYMEPFEKLMYDFNGETFNIGADKEYSLNEVADIVTKIANELGYEVKRTYLEKRDEVHVAYSDHTKAKNLLNFKDDTNLEKTVREMFTWASKIPPKQVKYANYEVTKNLYPYWKK